MFACRPLRSRTSTMLLKSCSSGGYFGLGGLCAVTARRGSGRVALKSWKRSRSRITTPNFRSSVRNLLNHLHDHLAAFVGLLWPNRLRCTRVPSPAKIDWKRSARGISGVERCRRSAVMSAIISPLSATRPGISSGDTWLPYHSQSTAIPAFGFVSTPESVPWRCCECRWIVLFGTSPPMDSHLDIVNGGSGQGRRGCSGQAPFHQMAITLEHDSLRQSSNRTADDSRAEPRHRGCNREAKLPHGFECSSQLRISCSCDQVSPALVETPVRRTPATAGSTRLALIKL